MASRRDGDDLRWETASYEQTVWDQLQDRHADVRRPRNPTSSTSVRGRRGAPNPGTASDADAARKNDDVASRRQREDFDDLVVTSPLGSRAQTNRSFYDAPFHRRSTRHAVDYTKLNRHRLKAHSNRNCIRPQKTYTELFSEKKQSYVGCTTHNHNNG